MSSHRLSASGERPFTLSAGGGAYSAFQVPAHAGDGVNISLSAVKEIVIPISAGARIEKRRYDGRAGGRDSSSPLETYVLVLDEEAAKAQGFGGHISQSINIHARSEGTHPVSNIDVRKSDWERDPAWPGWGEYEVIGQIDLPKFAMGEEEVAAHADDAPPIYREVEPGQAAEVVAEAEEEETGPVIGEVAEGEEFPSS